jgi:deazaflavin-dependent oxidoreductase (nitroreductase family)
MAAGQQAMPPVPTLVRLADPLARRLLGFGLPMGPNMLLTVRGRKSGTPRTVGVAVVEVDGRRWVVGTFGDVNWVRNLRAAREGVLGVGRRQVRVRAVELGAEEAAAFFTDVIAPYIRRLPFPLRLVTRFVMRLGGVREILDDPAKAARTRPVFELHALPD